MPLKYTGGNCALAGIYCIEVEEGIRNCCNDKILSILSSKAHLHKNGKALLILLRMADLNQSHMEKLWFMVLMVDDCIRMSMSEINDEDYFSPVTELEDDENE